MSFRILRENELQISAETRKINRPDQDLFITPLKEAVRLREFYDRSLQAAIGEGSDTVLFALSDFTDSGINRDEALQIAIDSFTVFLEEHEIEIILVTDDAFTGKISGTLFESIEDYFSDSTGGEVLQSESYDSVDKNIMPEDYDTDGDEAPGEGVDALEIGFGSAPFEAFRCYKSAAFMRVAKETGKGDEGDARGKGLDALMREMKKDNHSFSQHLQGLINKKGLKNSEVYASANISKQYFSKLMSGQVKPSKEKVMALAVGLRFNMDETIDFLRFAGYAFSPLSQTDTVVAYFIEHQDYSVIKIDIVLFDYGLEPLSGAG